MLRVIFVIVVFALVTLILMPLQWLAITFKRPLRRRIPVLYHRLVCWLLGIRVRGVRRGFVLWNIATVARRQFLLVCMIARRQELLPHRTNAVTDTHGIGLVDDQLAVGRDRFARDVTAEVHEAKHE